MTRLGWIIMPLMIVALGCGRPSVQAPVENEGKGAGGDSGDGRGAGPGQPSVKPPAPPFARASWHPKELAGIAGSEAGRHWGPIRCVAYSADGKFIASGGDDRTVRVWDAATLRPVQVLAGHEGAVLGVAFRADGKKLASAGADQAIRLWDLSTEKGEEPDVLKWHQCPVSAVAFAPGGKTLATAGATDGAVVLWDVSGANPKKGATLEGHDRSALRLEFSTDGKRLRAGAKVWDVTTSPPRAAPAGEKGPASWAVAAPERAVVWAVSAAGDRVAFTAEDHQVRLKHVGGVFTADIALSGHTAAVHALAFSPDGKALVSGGDERALRLWTIGADRPAPATAVQVNETKRKTGPKALSADGKTLAIGLFQEDNRDLLDWDLWDVSGPKAKKMGTVPAAEAKKDSLVGFAVGLSPDGKRVAVGGPHNLVRLFEVGAKPKELARFAARADEGDQFHGIASLFYSPDSKRLAVLYTTQAPRKDGMIRVDLWDVSGAKPKHQGTLRGPTTYLASKVVWSPDRRRLALRSRRAGTDFSRVEVFDAGKDEPERVGTISTGGVVFSPDGKQLLTAALAPGGLSFKVWDLSKNLPQEKEAKDLRAEDTSGLTYLPDGKTLVHEKEISVNQFGKWFGYKYQVSVYAVGDDPTKPRLKCSAQDVVPLAVAGPGRRVALESGSWTTAPPRELLKVVTLFSLDYTESKPRPPAPGHTAPLRAVAMSKDLLATAGADKGFRLWKLGDGALAERATVAAHEGPVTALAFSPDGKRLASGGKDRTVLLWDISSPKPKELPTYTGHNSPVTALAYSSDGKELIVTSEAGVTLWDVTGKRPKEKKAGADKALPPAKEKEKTEVKPYDQLEGRPNKRVAFVALPQDQVRVAAGEDGSITVWDAAGTKLKAWKFPAPVAALALSTDGKRLATANPNGTAYVLRLGK